MASLRDSVQYLLQQGYSTQDVADIVGVSRRTAQRYATGEIKSVMPGRSSQRAIVDIMAGNRPGQLTHHTRRVGSEGLDATFIDTGDLPPYLKQLAARNERDRGNNFRLLQQVPRSSDYPNGIKSTHWFLGRGTADRTLVTEVTESTLYIVTD